ncbi:fimbrial protein, partial [Rosenbergiella epipactidis]|uniref:fimbrial protein n=1 Tax=Rosenbergiella epipactidis TaxID=1544694 RepID=UPI001F4F7496
PFPITTSGCIVNNTALTVPMGNVLASNFHGINTWPGDANTKKFSIPLDCSAGTKVALQMDGNVQNATQGVIKLNSGSGSATGVGIQLLYNNAPLQLSTPIDAGSTSSDGEYDIPLQARYYQIASNITPGTANGTATFTLTYQ